MKQTSIRIPEQSASDLAKIYGNLSAGSAAAAEAWPVLIKSMARQIAKTLQPDIITGIAHALKDIKLPADMMTDNAILRRYLRDKVSTEKVGWDAIDSDLARLNPAACYFLQELIRLYWKKHPKVEFIEYLYECF